MNTLSLRHLLSSVALAAVSLLCNGIAHAAVPPSQQAYVKASNAESSDQFGYSVAISGNTMVVGAPFEDARVPINGDQSDNSLSNCGAVYVFVRVGTQWVQQAYLKASTPGENDEFGHAVAISGNTIVVGVPKEDSNAMGIGGDQSNDGAAESGAAYVFVRTGSIWTQQAYLKASNTQAGDSFGFSVAVSGNTILVGAHEEDSEAPGGNGNQSNNDAGSAGAAYAFVRSGTVWSQQAYLKAANVGGSDFFGVDVALSGETAVIGAYWEDSDTMGVNTTPNDTSSDSGAAYVFQRTGVTWVQQAYLKASNTDMDDRFGESVAIYGDTIVVGAWQEASNAFGVNGNETDDSQAAAGAAYVFQRTGTRWNQQAYLKASNTGVGDRFGRSVDLSADSIIVGAFLEDSNATGIDGDPLDNSKTDSGAAYLFTRTGTTWTPQAYLKASNTSDATHFGRAVALSGELAVVGSPIESSDATGLNGDGSNSNAGASGAAYVFRGVEPVLDSLARTGSSVDGVQDVAFSVPGFAALSEAGNALFSSSLTGTGAPRGREQGMFAAGVTIDLLLQKRDGLAGFGSGFVPGSVVSGLVNPCANQSTYGGIFQMLATGTGINANNNQALIRDNGAFLKLLGRTGQPVSAGWGTAKPKAFPEVVQSFDSDVIAVTTRLLVSSPDGVTASNDSGLLVLDHSGSIAAATPLREDAEAVTGTGNFGQFSGRVATTTGNVIHFTGLLKPTGGGAPLNSVFATDPNGAVPSQIKQTDPAAGAIPGSPTFTSFPALSQRGADPMFRAMLMGPTSAQNEGLWSGGSLILQKGVPFQPKGVDFSDALNLVDFPNLQVTRILRFWPVAADQVIIHAVLSGPGVTRSNNVAVLLRQADGEWVFLLRSGQVAPGCGSNNVKVGAIQGVDVEPIEGSYAIVAGLIGTSSTSNQALLAGRATAGSFSSDAARQRSLPSLRLRKGDPYATDRTARDIIRSISLKVATDPTGAGGRGLGQAVNPDGDIVVTLTGDRRIQELILIED